MADLANRVQQVVNVALDAADSYVLATLPDGRAVQLFGNGTFKVEVSGVWHFRRLPSAADLVQKPPSRAVKRGR